MKLKSAFLFIFVISNLACAQKDDDVSKDWLLRQKNQKVIEQGCAITVKENSTGKYYADTDCSGVAKTCENTDAAVKALNDYRAQLYADKNRNSPLGLYDQAVNECISTALLAVKAIRAEINPACVK